MEEWTNSTFPPTGAHIAILSSPARTPLPLSSSGTPVRPCPTSVHGPYHRGPTWRRPFVRRAGESSGISRIMTPCGCGFIFRRCIFLRRLGFPPRTWPWLQDLVGITCPLRLPSHLRGRPRIVRCRGQGKDSTNSHLPEGVLYEASRMGLASVLFYF